MWLGIPWWVWVFVIPELVITAVFVVVVLPIMGLAALIEWWRSSRGPRS